MCDVEGNGFVHFALQKTGKLVAVKPAWPCEGPYLGLIFWDYYLLKGYLVRRGCWK